ncbi:hypothetical protein, partial [Stenotrophomonas maltophilia]|uniref:hypothetical protein n=1 Tax=Stenotrophomonas maltophilia TaxID=40324 RepID=UPI0013D96033
VESRVQRIRHIKLTMILTLIMGVIGMFATPLVVFIIRDGHSPSPQTLRVILDYVALTFSSGWWVPHQIMLQDRNFIPIN